MLKLQTWEEAQPSRKALRKDTFEGHITDIIATHQERRSGEQAFLVEQDPHWVTPTHYHLEQQFQVIMAGHGTIGRHDVTPLCVHYAAPETAYGPIVAGPDGVSYLTLRMSGDTSAWYLHKPGSRERMQPGLKREQQHGAPEGRVSADALASLARASVEVLIAPRPDGLAAHLLRIAPGQVYPGSNESGDPLEPLEPAEPFEPLEPAEPADTSKPAHAGRYYVITQGSVSLGGQRAEARSVAFASADENVTLQAGPQGAEVVVLQFPVQALAPIMTPIASATLES